MYECGGEEPPTKVFPDWLENVVSEFKKLSDKERNATFEALIDNSTSKQYLYLSEKLGDLLTRDFLRMLPAELNYRILSYLSPDTLLLSCLVSSSWNKVICSYQHGWKDACVSIGARLPKLNVDFKSLYVIQKQQLEKIRRGETFETSILEGHIGGSSAFFHWNGKLATGGTDGNVRIWDVESRECLQIFATGCSVSCGKFDDSILLTGNYSDKSIVCWDMRTCEEKHRFVGHTNSVECMDYDTEMDMLVSGSHDLSLKMWKLSTGQLLSTMDSLPATPIAVHFMPDKSEPIETRPCSECAYTIVSSFRTYNVRFYHYHAFFLRLNCRHRVIVKCDLKNLTTAYDLTSLSFGTLRAELAGFRAKTSRLPSLSDFQTIDSLLPHERVYFSSMSSYSEHFGVCFVQNGSRNLVLFKRHNGQEITRVEVPLFCRYQILPGSDTLGSKDWMSGMDNRTCKGLLFAIGTYGGEVMVVKWKSEESSPEKPAPVRQRKESQIIELNPSRRIKYQISD
ncbi:F-box/WD repeat-containing protein 2-like [Lineus longissimus]|uniref:F-box/WD repeat-containing protein 2-like n=1 Tax=Lineus longissimus TaxID=88925 RepID=UPI002B4E8C51